MKDNLLISVSWYIIFDPLFPLLEAQPKGILAETYMRMFIVALPLKSKKLVTIEISINRRMAALIVVILYHGILMHNEKKIR